MAQVGHRKDIQGLRALSVALVVFFHLHLRGSGGGFIGVDVFFVISGFLTTSMVWSDLDRGRFNYVHFVSARAARIWPALAVMICMLLALGALSLPPFDLKALADQALWAVGCVSNLFFLDRSGYSTRLTDNGWLLHTWSLSVEAQFWLLYPVLLMAVHRIGKRPSASGDRAPDELLTAVLLLCFLASLAYQATQLGASTERAFFLFQSRAWELVAGGLVYALGRRRAGTGPRHTWTARVASYGGVALILGSALWFGFTHLAPPAAGYHALLPVAGAALVLWAGGADNRLLDGTLAQHVGERSYSIYLWHWPLIIALRLADGLERHPWLTAGVVVLASAGLASLSFRFVERTIRFDRATWTKRAAARPLVVMGVAGTAAAVAAATQGLSFRGRPDDFAPDPQTIGAPYFPARCDNFKKPVRELVECPIERGPGRRVLVIGDSHAEHFYPWFERRSEVSVDFFTVPECPPVPALERMQAGYHCLDYAAEAWNKAGSSRYDTVVVAARWATVMSAGLQYCHEVGDNCGIPPESEKETVLRAELGAAIERTTAAGVTVVFVKPTPESRLRVPQRVARELFWFGEVRLTIDRQSVVEATAWLEPLWERLAKNPRFRLVSLLDELCHGELCSTFDPHQNRPIYADDSHFDPAWIVRHGDVFAPFVGAGERLTSPHGFAEPP